MDGYKTLLGEGAAEYIVNKSRFYCEAIPAECEEDALRFIRERKKKYPDATHHCYAYVIGENAGIIRYSDDGEPGGTAGLPMMEVIRARQIVNCCVVITRYFGGILLGAGGLVRAYSHSCALALEAAGEARMTLSRKYLCSVPYPLWDKVSYLFKSLPVILEDTSFGQDVEASFLVRAGDAEVVLSRLSQETNARAETLELEESFYPWKDSG